MDIDRVHLGKLVEIAKYVGLANVEQELNELLARAEQNNAMLVLPLVGEFSSGKTTLINALTDSKKLETATKPTTATIYEVHFGCDKCHATVLTEDNSFVEVEDIADLKNETLADAKVVTVFDTSKKVPETTIIVDTPGLSSPDPKHKQTLVDFLPKADGILLVTDINQQITRSLTDFIDTMKLSQKPIFLILTKSDTKAENEVASVKEYIGENCKIPVEQIAVVSAQTGNLAEMEALLSNIQKQKNAIIKKVDTMRMKNLAVAMSAHIDELMKASSSDKEMDEAIRRSQYELEKISRNIDKLVDDVNDDIEDLERTISRKFEDTVSSKLNALVAGSSTNFDAEAVGMINSTASLLMNEYKDGVGNLLREKARARRDSDEAVYLSSADQVDMSGLSISGLSYNLNLNQMGHEYDGWIKTGLIAVAAVGAGAAVIATGGAAAAGGAAIAGGKAIDLIDTATDIGSMVSNAKTRKRIEQAQQLVQVAGDNYQRIENMNIQGGQQVGTKGILDSIIGGITEKTMAKPQRVRAIRNYVDGQLAPEFKSGLQAVSQQLVNEVRVNLQNSATEIIAQKTETLNKLKHEMREKKSALAERLSTLRQYKTTLINFK